MEKGQQRLVLITGTSSGIGRETAKMFLKAGYSVVGLDCEKPTIEDSAYLHYICDVSEPETLPEIDGICILINNAGTIEEDRAIAVNLKGYINVGEKYAFQPTVECVVNVGSISGRVGLDTPCYSASQGGRIAYTKNLAIRLQKPVNLVSFGAVLSGLEPYLYEQPHLVEAVARENLLNKWIMPEEAAEWVFFMATKNRSMTGQDILIDNGEEAKYNFIKAR